MSNNADPASSDQPLVECLVGLGANLGDRRATLDAALQQIASLNGVELHAASNWSASVAVGGPQGQDDFLNGAVRLRTRLPAKELLRRLRAIETHHGRERRERWAARTLDSDLLLYGEGVIDLPDIEVPHPRMTFRPFVMEPAVEIAPTMRHPKLAATLAEIDQRRRRGENRVVLVGGAAADRDAVREILHGMSPVFSVAAEEDIAGEPKLQVLLDGEAEPLAATPALWLPPARRERWSTEIAAAVECLWPAE